MTELERMLKESLVQTEQILRNSQISQNQTLLFHSEKLINLKNTVRNLQAEQAALAEHLTRLSNVYESLQPLLTRLNALLPGK